MTKLIIWAIIIYLIYKVVFELVIPVSKATSQMRDTISKMQQQQNKQEQATTPEPTTTQTKSTALKDADYIDFEEVK